ncbi:MAG: efflux RND transporter periplasmic adaptor subunit [Planctomycetales bacterium]|nr:efflux RND transporter periplasmic adaptor subunit [Planctomycetales bacterium]
MRRITQICLLGLVVGCWGTLSGAAEISSFTEPAGDVKVASSEMGTLAYVRVQEGTRVTQNQILAGLDDSVLQAALSIAEKAKQARGRLDAAKVELDLQTDRLEKFQALFQRQHASAEELARAVAHKRQAAAQLRGMREELEVKEAEYARIEAQLAEKKIRSPLSGIVTHVFKQPGEFISAADPVVLRIVNLDTLLAEFPVPALAADQFKVGQKVPLCIGPQRAKAEGNIEFVSPLTDAQSNTVRVKMRIDNGQGQFPSGAACWLVVDGYSPTADRAPGHFTNTRKK